MIEIKNRWNSVTDREKWAARRASFVAKAKATKAVWFPPKLAEGGENTASAATTAIKNTTTKATNGIKKVTEPVRRTKESSTPAATPGVDDDPASSPGEPVGK